MGISFTVSTSGSDLLTSCWSCLAKPTQYICELEEKLEALGTKMEEVSNLKNDVEERVKIVERQNMKEVDEIKKWVTQVDATEASVIRLRNDAIREIERNFSSVCCPWNWKSSYRWGEEVARKKDDVTSLYEKGRLYQAAADRLISFPVDERPGVSTVGLESTFKEVWGYMEDKQVGIIGLWGMGGIGKTALLTKINKESSNPTHGFNPVIWVTVSRNLDPSKIQIAIGKKIRFNVEGWESRSQEEDIAGRAIDILNVLNKRKFLLLLDDIWERIDLDKVGVPFPNNQNGSKVVFTTRSQVVCGLMRAKPIEVKLLESEPALVLFTENVTKDTIDAHPKIPELAKIVVAKCGRLPLALVTVGRTMACKKTPQQWYDAIEDLKKYPAKFPGMGKDVFPLLMFSYDSLSSDKERSCFLYCSLFPEDYLISKEILIGYWIGEGFLDGDNDSCEPQKEGRNIIDTLVHVCLLEQPSSDEANVKMHDMMRDMALWIACENQKVKDKFFVRVLAGRKEAPEIGKWTGINRMSLMHNHIKELKDTPSNYDLSTLLLNNNELEMITPGFFQNMSNLRVLDLSHNVDLSHYIFLPKLPSENFELVSLGYLNLSYTKISELPMEFKNFAELKYLGLAGTHFLKIIPQGVLSSLKRLQVLDMFSSGSPDLEVEDNVLLGELKDLKDLKDLGITIRSNSALLRLLETPKFQSCARRLSLWLLKDSRSLDMSFLERLRCLDELELKGFKNICVEWEREEGMADSEITSHSRRTNSKILSHSLRVVHLTTCWNLKDLTWLIFAPNLEKLTVSSCKGMKEIISRREATEEVRDLKTFAKLKSLSLSDLPELRSIYPNAHAVSFPCLEYLLLRGCPNFKVNVEAGSRLFGGASFSVLGPD